MKLQKARKCYDCDLCIYKIEKGQLYYFGSTRIPVFDNPVYFNNQTGIEYLKTRVCVRCKEEHETGGDFSRL